MGVSRRFVVVAFALLFMASLATTGCSLEEGLNIIGDGDIEKIKDSVVMIETFDVAREPLATGSGFAAYNSNWIITNMHVIEEARFIDVITDDGERLTVEGIVLYNKRDDLAILRIDGELKPLTIGKTENLKVTDKITAIGSPKGERNTVSEGIISNIDVKGEIRITAPISHGSSGGVLLNEHYEVIGITNAGYDDAQNLNFAIDISLLESMYESYINKKYDELNAENYVNFIPHHSNPDGKNALEINTKKPSSSRYNYTVDSLETFYLATNKFEIFDTTIDWLAFLANLDGHGEGSLYNRYFELDANKQLEAAGNYIFLLEYETDILEETLGSATQTEIRNWEIEEYILRMNLLSIYELAVFMTEIDGDMIANDAIIDYMNETNMSYEAKIIINKLLDNTDNRYNEDILDVFNGNAEITYDQEVALLEYLGMTVDENGRVWWD